ncbi:MAG: hypothetical protein N2652_05640 [Kiritimatiellae bacterium]|nr:hypothetical protein [Kiritimatiellia bacterium]
MRRAAERRTGAFFSFRIATSAGRWRLAPVLAAAAALARAPAPPPFGSPKLPVVTGWIGNTYAGAERWVPQDIADLALAPGGRLFSNVPWEEGGGNCTEFHNGEVVGHAGHTHGWGHEGGHAVAANSRYLFIAGRMGNEGGHLCEPQTWPPKGFSWIGVSRRPLSNIRAAAPFPGAKGGAGGTLKSAFLVVDEVQSVPKANAVRSQNIAGLAATDRHLFVSCPYAKAIRVYDAETMARLAEWPFDRPGPLALAPDGTLWVLQEREGAAPPAVLPLTAEGRAGEPKVCFEADADPADIAFAPNGRLLVADDGPRQQILVWDVCSRPPRQVGAIGRLGGIHAEPAGRIEPLKFNRPRAIACDTAGVLYVAHQGSTGGGSTVLEAYGPDSSPLWRLFGLCFVDMADVDPQDDRQLYTKEERFELDHTRTAGRDWTYCAYTVDRFRFPDDPRLHIWSAGAWVRRLAGRRLLFVNDMTADHLQVYRFGEAETAIPSGLFAKRAVHDGRWPPHQPRDREWIWRDANGNGRFDPDEYEAGERAAPPADGWWVDMQGDVWLATLRSGIRRFRLRGFDESGNPCWSYRIAETYPHPGAFDEVKRLRYLPEPDVMFLGGTGGGHRNQHWKPMGPILARYDRWSVGGATSAPTWQIVLPYQAGSRGHESCEPMSFDVAGEYVFVAYTGASRSERVGWGRVEVLRADDGRSVGHLEPPAEIGQIGLQDIRECLRAHRRHNGEYLVLIEDDLKAKLVMYRWRP